jgi:hypothetical protein
MRQLDLGHLENKHLNHLEEVKFERVALSNSISSSTEL